MEFVYELTQAGRDTGVMPLAEAPNQHPRCTRRECERTDLFYDSTRDLVFCGRHIAETVGRAAVNITIQRAEQIDDERGAADPGPNPCVCGRQDQCAYWESPCPYRF